MFCVVYILFWTPSSLSKTREILCLALHASSCLCVLVYILEFMCPCTYHTLCVALQVIGINGFNELFKRPADRSRELDLGAFPLGSSSAGIWLLVNTTEVCIGQDRRLLENGPFGKEVHESFRGALNRGDLVFFRSTRTYQWDPTRRRHGCMLYTCTCGCTKRSFKRT